MDNIKNIITGGIITLVIGGTAFSFSQQDVIDNFAEETGFTPEQAEQYVNDIPEEELVSFSELGSGYVQESEETLSLANEIDCVTYKYEWESPTLTCVQAKSQLTEIAGNEKALGQAFIQLDSDSASEDDIRAAIAYTDQLNTRYELEVSRALFDAQVIEEMKMTNIYNKSLLKAALESD